MYRYETPSWISAATTGKGEELDEARAFGVGAPLVLPRQTHTDHVVRVYSSCRPEDTDAVFTDVPGLCLAVKTADCIPVLLYDNFQHSVAAIHAGWKGTVQYIVEKTIRTMGSKGGDLSAIIGPGISLESFEVGDEVYERFLSEGFPMSRIARKFPNGLKAPKWHIDLWDANIWILEQCGVQDIFVAGVDTMTSPLYYSARRETINTGRNYNWIMLNAESSGL
jgi:YfiH family protein